MTWPLKRECELMAKLCMLADPESYRAFDWDMAGDAEALDYWIGLFETYPCNVKPRLIADGLAGDDFDARWSAFLTEYEAGLTQRRADPASFEMSTIALGTFRQAMLDKHGWPDPYLELKRRENEMAVGLYPQVISAIDLATGDARWEMLFRGIFAGNMFDMGAPKTIEMYNRGQIDFLTILKRIAPRPWFIDDADELSHRFTNRTYRKALFFVDNAGTDIALGVLPMVREMARLGMQVVLAANSSAALNDITHDELVPLLTRLAKLDPVLAELMERGHITTVATGSNSPLIDLSNVSEACNEVARSCEFLVLEGMGRGVESNWRQRFACDSWRVALTKDVCVARWLGCELFQPICRFEAGASTN